MSELIALIQKASITLPVAEISILVVALTVCLTFNWTRSGLVIAYIFVYHWGWLFFARQNTTYFAAYLILGGIVITLAIVDMLQMHSAK